MQLWLSERLAFGTVRGGKTGSMLWEMSHVLHMEKSWRLYNYTIHHDLGSFCVSVNGGGIFDSVVECEFGSYLFASVHAHTTLAHQNPLVSIHHTLPVACSGTRVVDRSVGLAGWGSEAGADQPSLARLSG